jgi:outer membrane protein
MIRLKTKLNKTEMRTLLFLLVFGLVTVAANAQTTTTSKIGFADPDYILDQMPESKQIETELQSVQNQLKTQLENKQKEFQAKLADYQKNFNTMLDAVKQNTERELQQLQQNLQKLQEDAQATIQNKQNQLLEPVLKKIGKAIEDVSKENGYTLVVSTRIGGLDVVLYGDDKVDISDLVLKKLGVTPKPAATTPATPK